jgi:hypothetical protein
MTVLNTLRDRLRRTNRRPASRTRRAELRPWLEGLEERVALTATPTTTTLVVTPSGSQNYGTEETLAATVNYRNFEKGPISGLTVSFFDGQTPIGQSVTSSSGTATFTTIALLVGTDQLTAEYAGSSSLASSTSPIVTETILPDPDVPTTTTVTPSVETPTYGQPETFTATISATSGTASPQGTVQFLVDGTPSGQLVALSADGTATFGGTALAPGTHTIEADFSEGDGVVSTGTSTVTFPQPPPPTTVTLTPSVAAPVFGQSETFTAIVAPAAPGTGTPTGTVTFMDSPATLGTGMLAVVDGVDEATFTTKALAAGTHAITAVYGGDPENLTSTSTALALVVGQDATTTTAVGQLDSRGGAVLGTVVTITVTANAPGSGVPSGSVILVDPAGQQYWLASALSLINGVATATQLIEGEAPLGEFTAVYSGDGNNQASSGLVMGATSTTAGFAPTTIVTGQPYGPVSTMEAVVGQTVTLMAAVTDSLGTPPTGTVTFGWVSDSAGDWAYSPPEPLQILAGLDVATFSIAKPRPGSFWFVAFYNGSRFNAASNSSSSAVPILTVDPAATTTSLAASPASAALGQEVTLSTTVAVERPGSVSLQGTVEFLDGTTVLGDVPVTTKDGVTTASLTTTFAATGTHQLSANYLGDSVYEEYDLDETSQGQTSINIGRGATTTIAGPSTYAPVRGQAMTLYAVLSASAGVGAPTGTVSFMYGSTLWAVEPLVTVGNKTYAAMPTVPMPMGTYTVTTVYSGDADDLPSRSSMTFTVGRDATKSAVNLYAASPVVGQPETIYAVVSPQAPGSGTPTGTVTFKYGAAAAWTEPLITVNGLTYATLPLAPLGPGTYAFTTVYNGDARAT